MRLLMWKVKLLTLWMMGSIVVNGFSPAMKQISSVHLDPMKNVPAEKQPNSLLNLVTCATAALLIVASLPISATAATVNPIEYLPTIQISEKIKELDFSLPSYDDIKSYKASTENVESLTIMTTPIKPGSLGLSTASSTGVDPTSSASDDVGNSVNSVMSSLLPSLSKKGPGQVD